MLTSELNQAQRNAVTAPLSPILVLAGAGAGKTRVVTHRILHLINEGISPKEILAVTFTNKAAKELKERVMHLCPKVRGENIPMVCTFHSLGVFILRRSIHLLNRDNNFIIYDQGDADKLLKQCLQKMNLKKALSNQAQHAISQAKNRLLLENLNPEGYIHSIIPIYKEYQQRLQEANAVDFDDLLFLSVKLFQDYPEAKTEYSELWKALLIDEYQDTNHAQYVMALTLAKKYQNIFAVGDPDQSIYSWRGANIHNILNFEKDYPQAQIIYLEDNYRSCANILHAANTLIQNNTSRLPKNLHSVKGPGEKIRVFLGKTDRDEAEFVVNEISRLHRQSQIPLQDICIFYRTNSQSRTFEDALLRHRVPYEIFGGISFYKRKEIQDILSFLRMLVSKHDVIAFERTIQLPKRGIGPTAISALIDYALSNNLPILKACTQVLETQSIKLSKKQSEGLRQYVHTFKLLEDAQATLSLSEFVKATKRITEYLHILQQEDPDTYEDRKSNLDALVAKAREWEQKPDPSLEAFLDDLALKSSTEEVLTTEDRVNLMTIHNGKGLEFRIAFIVGLEEKLFPHANSNNIYENLEEERRLCYVGITRAQDLLYLTAAQTRSLWNKKLDMKPSRFLLELPKDCWVQVH
ncbi:ATP-dependent helicase [Chlamydia gallinacea]|uniref:ATP-dependent helicase n=1 Tax=Chlamydia gallinacea TaxID=1457153 RepID=UPI0024E19B2D|nr:UvrD-helicase domain-containing protein [Chlamydia gallinacea]